MRAPLVIHDCSGPWLNWQQLPKSHGPCDIGVEGNLFLGTQNDPTGQIDVTNGDTQFRQFQVSAHEGCTITVHNPQARWGIRLAMCLNAGASMTRITYPQNVEHFNLYDNYYDVQGNDNVLIFHLASRETTCETATFMWGPMSNI